MTREFAETEKPKRFGSRAAQLAKRGVASSVESYKKYRAAAPERQKARLQQIRAETALVKAQAGKAKAQVSLRKAQAGGSGGFMKYDLWSGKTLDAYGRPVKRGPSKPKKSKKRRRRKVVYEYY
jgi:hypothetical protein